MIKERNMEEGLSKSNSKESLSVERNRPFVSSREGLGDWGESGLYDEVIKRSNRR